jgi:hypothetical protein
MSKSEDIPTESEDVPTDLEDILSESEDIPSNPEDMPSGIHWRALPSPPVSHSTPRATINYQRSLIGRLEWACPTTRK